MDKYFFKLLQEFFGSTPNKSSTYSHDFSWLKDFIKNTGCSYTIITSEYNPISGQYEDKVISNLLTKTENQKRLETEIQTLKSQIKEKVDSMAFEEAIPLRETLKGLENELEEEKALFLDEVEKNKSTKQILVDLNKRLEFAVQSEKFEEAARLRDEIKNLKEKLDEK